MSNKHRCYAALDEIAGNNLSGLSIGNHRHHLPKAGAIVELQIMSNTCLLFRVDPDSESTRANIVEYQVDHKTKEAESVCQWTASKVTRQGDRQRHIRELERVSRWTKEESLPAMLLNNDQPNSETN